MTQPTLFDLPPVMPTASPRPEPSATARARAQARAIGGRYAATNHRCPSPGCSFFIPIHRLACSTHWHSLSEQLRSEINATYRRDTRRHLELYREAVRLLVDRATREASP